LRDFVKFWIQSGVNFEAQVDATMMMMMMMMIIIIIMIKTASVV
jgi:hypothetical protein